MTTTTCAKCGNEIPACPMGEEALCTACRYHDVKPAPSWDDGTETAGQQVEPTWIPGETSVPFQYPDEPGQTDVREDAIAEALRRFIEMLTSDSTPLAAGQVLHFLAMQLGIREFKTAAEFGRELNISAGRVSQIKSQVPEEFASLLRLRSRQKTPPS